MTTIPDSVTVGGTLYLPATEPNTNECAMTPLPDVRIVIGQRGWVWVGRYALHGDRVYLTGARNIRKWGTTRGLGELVDGPLANTVLDPAGSVELHELGVVAAIEVDAAAWLEHLS